ncbi:hypothetical protein ZWY2020_000128 [Hordeum vulgare]|nr:hypothetical protein ZWY2020_000128 [Hordeum vulgare]
MPSPEVPASAAADPAAPRRSGPSTWRSALAGTGGRRRSGQRSRRPALLPRTSSSLCSSMKVKKTLPLELCLGASGLDGGTGFWKSLSVEKYPGNSMMGCRESVDGKAGKYTWVTYKEVYDTVIKVGASIRSCSVNKGWPKGTTYKLDVARNWISGGPKSLVFVAQTITNIDQ